MADTKPINKAEDNLRTGYIRLFRSIQDHWIWKDEKKLKWWLDILMTANHADKKIQIGFDLIECKRGQTVFSLKTWSARWKVDISTVRRFFRMLEDDHMICTENVQKTTRLTVCNYESYNSERHPKQSISNREANDKQTQDNPNNNVKNDNNDKNVFSEAQKKMFDDFSAWIKENAYRVTQMKEPLTIVQYFKLTERFGKIGYVFIKMHNYKPLLEKNMSAYLTAINWIEREEGKGGNTTNQGSTGLNKKDEERIFS